MRYPRKNIRERKHKSKLFLEHIIGKGYSSTHTNGKRHCVAFVNLVLNYVKESGDKEGGKALLEMKPVFTSTEIGETAQAVLEIILNNSKLSETFVDVEVQDQKLLVYFDEGAKAGLDTVIKQLQELGEAEIVMKPNDKLFAGVASNFYAFALVPNLKQIESLTVRDRRNDRASENQTKISEDTYMSPDISECKKYGLNPAFFSDAAIAKTRITEDEARELFDGVFGEDASEDFAEGETGSIIRTLGFTQHLIPGYQLPESASEFDLQLAEFNDEFFSGLAEEYDLEEGEILEDELEENEAEALIADYSEAFVEHFHDLDAEELVDAVFDHTVNPVSEDYEHRKEVTLVALEAAEAVEDELFEEMDITDEDVEEAWKPVKRKPMGPLIRRAIKASKAGKQKKKVKESELEKPSNVSEEVWEDAVEIVTEVAAQNIRKGMLRAMSVKGFLVNNQYNKNPSKSGGKAPGTSWRYPGVNKWKKFVSKFPKGYNHNAGKRKGT